MNAQKIKELRNTLGFTQLQFATKLGVSLSTVFVWEKGSSKPSALALEKLIKLKKTINE